MRLVREWNNVNTLTVCYILSQHLVSTAVQKDVHILIALPRVALVLYGTPEVDEWAELAACHF